jgi:hypothetical protein
MKPISKSFKKNTMLPNRLDVTITSQQVTDVNTHLQAILTALPFLITLTPEQRKEEQGINVANKIFVEDAIANGKTVAPSFPPWLKVADIEKDLQVFTILDGLIPTFEGILQQMKDTRQVAGYEANQGSLSLYRILENMAKLGIPGAQAAFNNVKARFAAQSKSRPKQDPPK